MARETAPTNQWKSRVGATSLVGYFIDDPFFAGFVTLVDAVPNEAGVLVTDAVHTGFMTLADGGAPNAYLLDDVNHSGFVTPDNAGTAATMDAFLIDELPNGFLTPNTVSYDPAAYLLAATGHTGFVAPDTTGTPTTASAQPIIIGGGDFAAIVET